MDTNNEYGTWQPSELALQHEQFGQAYQFINYATKQPRSRGRIFIEDVHVKDDQVRCTFCEFGMQNLKETEWTYAAILISDLEQYIIKNDYHIDEIHDVVAGQIIDKPRLTPPAIIIEQSTEWITRKYIEEGFEIILL